MSTKAEKAADLAHALETITKSIKPPVRDGERSANGYQRYESRPVVYASVKHVSKSGMSRDIAFYAVDESGDIVSLTWAIGTLIGCRVTDNGVRVSGCGMDMRFWALDCLAHKLGGAFSSGNDFEIRSL